MWVAAPPRPRYTRLARQSGAAVRCIHDTTPDACQVCNGYARWLIADPDRLRRAQARPEEVRREFWRAAGGAIVSPRTETAPPTDRGTAEEIAGRPDPDIEDQPGGAEAWEGAF